ncbi:asparaginase [Siminovitchia acidinfaciens]|uniref:asparaginase n=1 Tax=Siminovitchia acidinfaciens TaxID=2321395 RepID=A0A429XY63_9BACI|nr:asparaginase [Siminovitchia acidinfaciens]RST73678.1 asparaginase [Siminovitchia acidinfaciens]
MKNILVIHTGGTISMEADTDNETVDIGDTNPMTMVTKDLNNLARLTVREPFQKPSPHITVHDMIELKLLIESECQSKKVDGVVITHGTDTMEETAFFLDLTLETDVPVVMTGAMRSSNETGSDGLYNFIAAIRTAVNEESKGKGLLVVFNDEIHTAKEVTKIHTTNAAGFQSIVSGPVGMITNKSITFHYGCLPQKKIKVKEITKRVALVKAYTGMDSSILEALKDLKYDGVVIEALGQGNLPPSAVRGIETLLTNQIPVVLVSRCLKGIIQDTYNYPGGGKQLKELGVIFCRGLSGQKARLKLLSALTQTDDILVLNDKYFS